MSDFMPDVEALNKRVRELEQELKQSQDELDIVQMAHEKALGEMFGAQSFTLKAEGELYQELHERNIWQAAAEMWQMNHAVRERERNEAWAVAKKARQRLVTLGEWGPLRQLDNENGWLIAEEER